MAQPKRQIFDQHPKTWRDLQKCVAKVFSEIGCKVHTEAKVNLPRGTVTLDVFVRDTFTAPHSNYVCECKNWTRRVPKSVVHGFRTVVSEIGANRGFLISRRGFQSGAQEAAQFTNIDLLSWTQFEGLMFDRWIQGITSRLNPLFASAFQLMDPDNSEKLWTLRKCNDSSYNEWDSICKRYPLITVWALFHWHSKVGLGRIPTIHLTDQGVLSKTGRPKVLDSYRKVVDAAPAICLLARQQLEKFWGIGPKRTTRIALSR